MTGSVLTASTGTIATTAVLLGCLRAPKALKRKISGQGIESYTPGDIQRVLKASDLSGIERIIIEGLRNK
ncbi:hypothetical protein J4447_05090 [Candidatus Pacearchaeota archaeon]|nr:hypothetical protein [Candidatus Pacearchaeota archaeon]